MIRTFYAVGQGGFYSEEFLFGDSSFKMIYDCGGSNKKLIEDEIKHAFNQEDIINAIFISHFHNDHINGLEFLQKHCKIEKVYLPRLHKNQEIKLLIENIIYGQNDKYLRELILHPQNIFRNQEIIFIEAFGEDILNTEENQNNSKSIKSGEAIKANNLPWIYVPFNFQDARLDKELLDELRLNAIDLDDLEHELSTKQSIFIRAYQKIFGKNQMNANSLVVYSGFKEFPLIPLRSYSPFIHKTSKAGCLYLGDYNAKEDEKYEQIKKAFNPYWDLIGTVQIPHHGSNHNFNQKLAWRGSISVVSAGNHKVYRHPHARTIKEIIARGSIPCIITDNPSSRLFQFFCDDLFYKYPEEFI